MTIFTASPARDYAVIDVETTPIAEGEIPRTLFWGYADGAGYHRFDTTRELVKFLRGRPEKILLHHSNFDVIQLLVDGCKDVQIDRSHNGRLIRCQMGRHTLQHTYCVFPVKLAKIFAAFGYAKTELSKLAKRNWEDCVWGLECFTKLDALFTRLVGVSPLERGTIAGTCFRAAENLAGRMPVDLRFLEAYRGGRVEVFNTRRQRAHKYDIHSSYPRSFLEVPARDELLHLRVKTRDWICPFFDAKRDDMLLFPNGEFSTWIFRSNLERYILPSCEKTRLRVMSKHAINFEWIAAVRSLIETIYNTKQTTQNDAIRLCSKLLLNSFYGRIGLKGETERCRILPFRPDGDDVTVYYLGGKKWICFDYIQRESRSNFPFAAFITDNARARLYGSFALNHPLYGDTDSLFSPAANAPQPAFRGTIGEGCGDWEFCGTKMFKAFNVKDYEWGRDEVRKGGHEFLTWTIKRFAAGKTATRTERSRQTGLRKRRVLPNGETMPLTVNN